MKRDKAAALNLLKRIMKKYGVPRSIVTDGLRAYSGDERDRCCRRAARGWRSAQQSRREFASAVSATRTSDAALSKSENAAEIQLNWCPGAQPIQSGAPSRHEASLQAQTLCCLGRVALPRGIDRRSRDGGRAPCRRAPVTLTPPFGEYLRAMITADRELVEDDKHKFRAELIAAFARRKIFPSDVTDISEDALLWKGPFIPLPDLPGLQLSALQLKPDPGQTPDPEEIEREVGALADVVSDPRYSREFRIVRNDSDFGLPTIEFDAYSSPCGTKPPGHVRAGLRGTSDRKVGRFGGKRRRSPGIDDHPRRRGRHPLRDLQADPSAGLVRGLAPFPCCRGPKRRRRETVGARPRYLSTLR